MAMMVKFEYSKTLKTKDVKELLENFEDPYSQVTIAVSDGEISVNSFLFLMTKNYIQDIIRETENFDKIVIPDCEIRFIDRYVKLMTQGKTTFCSEEEKKDFMDFMHNILGYHRDLFSDNCPKVQDDVITSFCVNYKKSPNTCRYCLRKFSSKSSRIRHEKICENSGHKTKKFDCTECHAHFRTKEGLKAHIIAKHESQGPFKCNSCSKEYKNLTSLLRHCADNEHDYPEIEEKVKQLSDRQLKWPILALPKEKCKICKKMIAAYRMDTHVKYYHNDRMNKCDLCEYKTKRRDNYKRHQREVHSRFKFDFETLNDNCTSKEYKYDKEIDGMKIVETEKQVNYDCPKCSSRFHSKEEIEDHLFLKNCKEIKCQICMKSFTMKQSLIRHMKKFHQDMMHKDNSLNMQNLEPMNFDSTKVTESVKDTKSIAKEAKSKKKKSLQNKIEQKIDIYNMRKFAREVKTPGTQIRNESTTENDSSTDNDSTTDINF